MLSRDEALTLCDGVLAHAKSAGAEDAIVSVQNSQESHARFADNRITTSGRSEDVSITATVWVGQRRGAATGNDTSPGALKQLGDEAVQIARVSPVHREYLPTLGPMTYAQERGFAESTANIDLDARA
jgi:PmbA protein